MHIPENNAIVVVLKLLCDGNDNGDNLTKLKDVVNIINKISNMHAIFIFFNIDMMR